MHWIAKIEHRAARVKGFPQQLSKYLTSFITDLSLMCMRNKSSLLLWVFGVAHPHNYALITLFQFSSLSLALFKLGSLSLAF